MKQIRIEGKRKLKGTIKISGAKNSAVALVPASLLSDEEVIHHCIFIVDDNGRNRHGSTKLS